MAKKKYSETASKAFANLQNMGADNDMGASSDDADDMNENEMLELLGEDLASIKKELDDAEGRGTEFIETNKLIPCHLNRYQVDENDESFKAILQSIKSSGFIEAFTIVCEQQSNGTAMILSGHRRTLVAKKLGIEKLPVCYVECQNDGERLLMIARGNLKRRDSIADDLGMYQEFEKAYEEGDFDNEMLKEYNNKREFFAAALGKSETSLRNIIFLLNFDSKIWRLIDEKVIPTTAMRTFFKKRNDISNYDEIIKELMEDSIVNNKELPLTTRKKAANAILNKTIAKGRPKGKKAHSELNSIIKKMNAVLEGQNIIMPTKENEKEKVLEDITLIKGKLNELENRVKNA